MQVPAPSTDLQRTQGLDVLSQRTGRSASPAAAWPCLAGAGGTACLGSDAAAQACHCPLEGTPRWENGFKSAPLPSSAGQLSMTQQSRSRAISRGICPRCHGWTGAWVTSIHPGIDEGPPPPPPAQPQAGAGWAATTQAAQRVLPISNKAHPLVRRRADERICQVPSSPPTGSSRGNFLPAGTSCSRALQL